LDLEKPRFSIFAKMAAKTTPGSGFLFRFVFSTLDLVENANNLEKCSPIFLQTLFGVKVKKLFFKVTKNFYRNFLILCGRCDPLPMCQNSADFD